MQLTSLRISLINKQFEMNQYGHPKTHAVHIDVHFVTPQLEYQLMKVPSLETSAVLLGEENPPTA